MSNNKHTKHTHPNGGITELQGDAWSGTLHSDGQQAYGLIMQHAWLLKIKNQRLSIEIAEHIDIEASLLPLVGFGCSGWLHEQTIDCAGKQPSLEHLQTYLNEVFLLFKQGKLTYLPSVSCSCSDEPSEQ